MKKVLNFLAEHWFWLLLGPVMVYFGILLVVLAIVLAVLFMLPAHLAGIIKNAYRQNLFI